MQKKKENQTNQKNEEWLPVLGFEKSYEVSNLGRIRSISRIVKHPFKGTHKINGKIRKQTLNSNGYRMVNLSYKGKTKYCSVHRLVCEAFNGAPATPKHQVAHNDGNKQNNNRENLRWATVKENMKDRSDHGNTVIRFGEDSNFARATETVVHMMRAMWRSGKYSQSKIGDMFGFPQSAVSKIVNKKRWKHID